MHSLPSLPNFETFQAWARADASQWLPVALDIARGHGLACASPHVFSTGTNLVVDLGHELILKIFPPMLRSKFISERLALAQLRGRLSVPIPEIVFEGERDRWPYLVITRLPGILGTEAWPALSEDQKERVLAQIGETIAEVQRVPVGELSGIEPGWRQFMSSQIQGCRARHERLGLPQGYLDGLDDLLRDAATLIPLNAPAVILTGEYIPENFLLSGESGRWGLSGLIDFGDVMTGWGEYDLLGPSAFMTAGGVRIRAGGHHALIDATVDGASSASSCQRSQQAHLHRGLAAESQRSVRVGEIALADLTARKGSLDCLHTK
jgi:hygromycin-B 7''-O-kinase